MAKNKVRTRRLSGGLGRKGENIDGVCAIITNGIAVASTFLLGTAYKLRSIEDLEALGVNAAYDTTNKTLIHHHIDRLFARNPSAEIHLMALAQTVTLANMLDIANVNNAKKLLKDQNGRIKLLGVIRNPAADYTPTLTTGLDAEVLAAIPKAQQLVDQEAAEFRYCSIVIEGRSYNGTAANAADLRALDAEGVSVVIAADSTISGSDARYAGYAAVGDFLGMLSKAAVSQDCGEMIEEFNLVDAGNDFYTNVGLSSNAKIETMAEASLTTLDEKGYIFAERAAGLPGAWFNDTHTCTLLTSDYAYIENNRTIDKIINLARIALLPAVKSRLKADETTGLLSDASRGNLEDIAKDSIESMKTDGDISGGIDAWIDPNTDVLAGEDIEVELTTIPIPIGRKISLAVGFKNPNK
jgi:hypothetical protein